MVKKHSIEFAETCRGDGVLSEKVAYQVSEKIIAPLLKYSPKTASGRYPAKCHKLLLEYDHILKYVRHIIDS